MLGWLLIVSEARGYAFQEARTREAWTWELWIQEAWTQEASCSEVEAEGFLLSCSWWGSWTCLSQWCPS